MPTPIDPVRAVLREHAHQILAAAARDGAALSGPISQVAGDDLLTVTILLAPAGTKTGRPLTPCERDVLAVLETARTRLSTSMVVKEMSRRGYTHGESTISKALIRLTKLGILKSSRRAPRGYYLPGKSYPLFAGPVSS